MILLQKMVPSTRNEEMAGRMIKPCDKGVLNLNDMYTTTNMATHRKFPQNELKGYPEKNVPTYWECEEYPKAWGHGMHEKYVLYPHMWTMSLGRDKLNH